MLPQSWRDSIPSCLQVHWYSKLVTLQPSNISLTSQQTKIISTIYHFLSLTILGLTVFILFIKSSFYSKFSFWWKQLFLHGALHLVNCFVVHLHHHHLHKLTHKSQKKVDQMKVHHKHWKVKVERAFALARKIFRSFSLTTATVLRVPTPSQSKVKWLINLSTQVDTRFTIV